MGMFRDMKDMVQTVRSDELKDSTAGGGYGHTAKISLAQFAPGRYVLRLDARPTLGKSDPIAREVEFTVR